MNSFATRTDIRAGGQTVQMYSLPALEKAGFGDIYHVQDGFEGPLDEKHHRGTISGWRHEGLPWEQS